MNLKLKIMKTRFTIIAFICSISFINAQEIEKTIQKNQFNFLKNLDMNCSKHDYTIGYERKINDEISLGFNINYFESDKYNFYESYNYTFTNKVTAKNSSIGISFSLNYDWSKMIGLNTKKFDIYTGTSFGVSHSNYGTINESYTEKVPTISFAKSNGNNYFIGAKVGARYWITKNIGLSAELDRSFYTTNINPTKFNVGMNFKF
jgi:hypothetical protein